MSSLDVQTMAEQPGQQNAQDPVAPGQSPSQTNVPGLPPTALSMQMQSLNDQYAQAQGGRQALGAQIGGGSPATLGGDRGQAVFGLQDMAERLARGYGLDFGRGSLIDAEGNFMMTPDQLAASSGGMGLDDVAANMNRISQAINDRRIDEQQNKATAALQTGLGQVQKRGRGSLAAMQSNFYQAMARNYTDPNLLPEQQDFSYWIQKGQLEEEESALAGNGGGAPIKSQPTAGDPYSSTDFGPQGKGDVVTSGPHAGQRPVYTYDPINQTTTITWEDA
jgi:hypothetical protein